MIESKNHKLSDYFDIESDNSRIIFTPKRCHSNLLVFDDGLLQTAICRSRVGKIDTAIPRIDYRGQDVTQLADQSDFLEVAHLLIEGSNTSATNSLKMRIDHYLHQLSGLPPMLAPLVGNTAPIDFLMLSVLTALASGKISRENDVGWLNVTAFLLSAISISISVYAKNGKNIIDIQTQFQQKHDDFITQILSAMFSYPPDPIAILLMNKFLILHAEHGMNCSTLVARAVASSGGDPFSAVIAGICAFKGTLHGGASQQVGIIYDRIYQESLNVSSFIDSCLSNKQRLMGFGHRIYHTFDPRAAYMKRLLNNRRDDFSSILPYLHICENFEYEVSRRPYFITRGIFPNPDLFNGILLRRIGFPSTMNTMLLCFSRTVGWLAHYYDSLDNKASILRPQEIY